MRATFSFLVADGTYEADLPDVMDARPSASTSIMAFGSVRQLGWDIKERVSVDEIRRAFAHVFDAEYAGYRVSVFERRVAPVTYSALWSFADGYLSTFVDERDHSVGALQSIIRGIAAGQGPSSVPRVRLSRPVSRAELDYAPFRDTIVFVAPPSVPEEEAPAIRFDEEPFSRRERMEQRLDGNLATLSAVRKSGVRVIAKGPARSRRQLKRLVGEVAASVRKVG